MNRQDRRLFSLVAACMLCLCAFASAQFSPPTPEELSMTSLPEVPGAPALYLFREQTTDDPQHTLTFYTRLKILTEAGIQYANVDLFYVTGQSGFSIDNITGRTIHPDGTIIPFTGKPYDKLVEKSSDGQFKSKVFTLPAVTVGSIIEYRYRYHFDMTVVSPDWVIQNELFVRKAHYMWRPTSHDLVDDKGNYTSNSVAWSPMLPNGVTVKESRPGGQEELDLDVSNIPPLPKADMMPPLDSFGYRVQFYYTAYKSSAEYWNKEGKTWSKNVDKFIGPGSGVKAHVAEITAPGDTPDVKLHKIYADVMKMENTDFTRRHTEIENRVQGLKNIGNTDDLLKSGRGSGDQLAELFVAMARAAGMKAYLAALSDRTRHLFLPNYLSFRQLDDYIAIVNIDDKDVPFDPGQRYCGYGHLVWWHAPANGMRQTDSGVALVSMPSENYKDEHVSRIADLAVDEHGAADGTVTLEYTGDEAVRWRQRALRDDDTSLNDQLRRHLESMFPAGMEIRVKDVKGLAEYDQPLKIVYTAKGNIGSSTGKRLLVPANLFEANSKAKFASATRDVPIDLHHASYVQDAVRFKLPSTITIESAPISEQSAVKGIANFSTASRTSPNAITLYRNVSIGRVIFAVSEYPDLRGFYTKLEAKDQEPLVLTHAAVSHRRKLARARFDVVRPRSPPSALPAASCCRRLSPPPPPTRGSYLLRKNCR